MHGTTVGKATSIIAEGVDVATVHGITGQVLMKTPRNFFQRVVGSALAAASQAMGKTTLRRGVSKNALPAIMILKGDSRHNFTRGVGADVLWKFQSPTGRASKKMYFSFGQHVVSLKPGNVVGVVVLSKEECLAVLEKARDVRRAPGEAERLLVRKTLRELREIMERKTGGK